MKRKILVIKDVNTPMGLIKAGKETIATILNNGTALVTYNTVCCYGTTKLKKGEYELINKM